MKNHLSWYVHRAKLRMKYWGWAVLCGPHWAAAQVYFFNPANVTKEMWLAGKRAYEEARA